jgi:hypothetical protein
MSDNTKRQASFDDNGEDGKKKARFAEDERDNNAEYARVNSINGAAYARAVEQYDNEYRIAVAEHEQRMISDPEYKSNEFVRSKEYCSAAYGVLSGSRVAYYELNAQRYGGGDATHAIDMLRMDEDHALDMKRFADYHAVRMMFPGTRLEQTMRQCEINDKNESTAKKIAQRKELIASKRGRKGAAARAAKRKEDLREKTVIEYLRGDRVHRFVMRRRLKEVLADEYPGAERRGEQLAAIVAQADGE